ncbi:MAG: threonine synthase [Armatimonadetes bacterium]|nr:threonine synthase [Armatimonadota bacterium]
MFLTGLRCLHCGAEYPAADLPMGCERCRTPHFASALTCTYDYEAIRKATRVETLQARLGWLWRYAEFLPVDPVHRVTMREGGTPLMPCPRLGATLGVRDLYLKDETRNPTWSFKDRLCSVAISKAREMGAPGIIASTTGNHGASTAAYAARAGLPCIIVTRADAPLTVRVLMQSYGARVVAVPTDEDRWKVVGEWVARHGWFSTTNVSVPPVGSTPFGVEGYKTIAYEIMHQLDWETPDVVVVPVSAGDALFGIWKGFTDLRRLGWIDDLPTMMAVEPFPAYAVVLERGAGTGTGEGGALVTVPGRRTVAFNVGTRTPTYQGLLALRESRGRAVVVEDTETMEAQLSLASTEGLYVEASSAVALAGVRQLVASGAVAPEATVVAVMTSSGLKDPEATAARLPQVPLIEPTAAAMEAALAKAYGFRV